MVPKPPCEIEAIKGHLEGAKAKERSWLEHAIKLMEKELDKDDILAWSAYHASLQNVSDELLPALTQLLPLFHDKAATAAWALFSETVTYNNTIVASLIFQGRPLVLIIICVLISIFDWGLYPDSNFHPDSGLSQGGTDSCLHPNSGMNVLRETTQFLNPGQIPVIALDAPLYALAKYVQWH